MNIIDSGVDDPGDVFLRLLAWLKNTGVREPPGQTWQFRCGDWDNPKPRMRIYEEEE